MPTRSACPSLTNVPQMMRMATAFPASRAMTSTTVPASSRLQTMPSLLIVDVELGTGTTKFVLLALRDGSSMPKRSAFLFLINAPALTLTETVCLATAATTLRKEPVFSLISTMPTPLTSVVPVGTGRTRSVLPARRDGSSTLTRPVCLLMTIATPTTRTAPALHATRAMEFTTEFACRSILSAGLSMLTAAVLLATLKMWSTMDRVFPSTNWQISCSTMLHAALRNLRNYRPNRRAIDFIRFIII